MNSKQRKQAQKIGKFCMKRFAAHLENIADQMDAGKSVLTTDNIRNLASQVREASNAKRVSVRTLRDQE